MIYISIDFLAHNVEQPTRVDFKVFYDDRKLR